MCEKNMILTIKGADFSGAGIGTNNSIRVQLTKTSGVSGSIVQNNFEKDQVVSTATVIANLAVVSGYENLTVTVTMGGTSVNAWYSNGVVTIPSNTTISGDIKISASATAVSGGGDTPSTPVIPSGTAQYMVDYNIGADGKFAIWPYTDTSASGKSSKDYRFSILNYFECNGSKPDVTVSGIEEYTVIYRFYDSNKNVLADYSNPTGSSYCRIIIRVSDTGTLNNYDSSTITINGTTYTLEDYCVTSEASNIALFTINSNVWSDGRYSEKSAMGRITIVTYIPTTTELNTLSLDNINEATGQAFEGTAKRYYDSNRNYVTSGYSYGRHIIYSTKVITELDSSINNSMDGLSVTINNKTYTLKSTLTI